MAKKEAEVHGIRIKETRADRTFNVLNLIFWMIVLFITLYPLWLVLIASVSDPDAVLAGEVLFWPKGFSLMGYEAVFQHSELWQSYLNSIIYTVLGSALSVIVSLAAAYALSRKFAGKAFVNFLITFTMFFSGGLIPIFLNVRDLGLYDTRLVMILMNTVSVWNLMVARTYIQSSIPNELYEAAVMDGADHFTYFFRCVLPLSGTIIAVLSVYYGVARWNDYFTGLVFIRNRAYLPLQTVLREILASLSISGSSDTFFAAYADNLGGLQESMRKAEVAKADCSLLALQLRSNGFEVHSGEIARIAPAATDILLLLAPRSELTGDEAQTLAAFLDNGGRMLVACGADTPLSRLTQLQAVCSLYGLGFQSGWVVENAAESDRYVDAPEYLSPVVAANYEITGRVLLPRASALITPALRPGVTVTPLLTTSDRAVLHPDASGNALDSQAGDVSGQFLLGAMAKKSSGTALSLLASSDMLRDSAAISGASVLDASDNLALLTDLVTDMADIDQTASLDAGVKRLPAQRVTFDSESSRQRITILALTLIPGVLLLTMAVVLLKRRRL